MKMPPLTNEAAQEAKRPALYLLGDVADVIISASKTGFAIFRRDLTSRRHICICRRCLLQLAHGTGNIWHVCRITCRDASLAAIPDLAVSAGRLDNNRRTMRNVSGVAAQASTFSRRLLMQEISG